MGEKAFHICMVLMILVFLFLFAQIPAELRGGVYERLQEIKDKQQEVLDVEERVLSEIDALNDYILSDRGLQQPEFRTF